MTLMAQGRQWVVQKDASGDIRRAVAGNPSTGQAVEAGVDKSAGVGGICVSRSTRKTTQGAAGLDKAVKLIAGGEYRDVSSGRCEKVHRMTT